MDISECGGRDCGDSCAEASSSEATLSKTTPEFSLSSPAHDSSISPRSTCSDSRFSISADCEPDSEAARDWLRVPGSDSNSNTASSSVPDPIPMLPEDPDAIPVRGPMCPGDSPEFDEDVDSEASTRKTTLGRMWDSKAM